MTRLRALVNRGLDGLEVYYSAHTERQTAHLETLAQRHGLLITGGSDDHGEVNEGRLMGRCVWGGSTWSGWKKPSRSVAPAARLTLDPTAERRQPAARTDDAADSFRWPEERRRATPPGSPEQPEALSPAWHSWAQRGLLAAGTLASLWIYLAPTPVGLSAAGKTAAAIFLFCTTLWVTNIVPFGVTGLLAISLLGILGAMRPAEAFAAFGNSAVFFLIGVFIIGGALVDSGLSKRWPCCFCDHSSGHRMPSPPA